MIFTTRGADHRKTRAGGVLTFSLTSHGHRCARNDGGLGAAIAAVPPVVHPVCCSPACRAGRTRWANQPVLSPEAQPAPRLAGDAAAEIVRAVTAHEGDVVASRRPCSSGGMSRDYGRSFALRFLRIPACRQVAVAEPHRSASRSRADTQLARCGRGARGLARRELSTQWRTLPLSPSRVDDGGETVPAHMPANDPLSLSPAKSGGLPVRSRFGESEPVVFETCERQRLLNESVRS